MPCAVLLRSNCLSAVDVLRYCCFLGAFLLRVCVRFVMFRPCFGCVIELFLLYGCCALVAFLVRLLRWRCVLDVLVGRLLCLCCAYVLLLLRFFVTVVC